MNQLVYNPIARKYNEGIFTCPTDRRTNYPVANAGKSYGYNSMGISIQVIDQRPTLPKGLGGRGPLDWIHSPDRFQWGGPLAESSVVAPSDMIALGDCYSVGQNENLGPGRFVVDVFEWQDVIMRETGPFSLGPSINATGRKRHQGQLNMAFCDGHVEGDKVDKLFFSKDPADMRRWNVDNEPHAGLLRFTR